VDPTDDTSTHTSSASVCRRSRKCPRGYIMGATHATRVFDTVDTPDDTRIHTTHATGCRHPRKRFGGATSSGRHMPCASLIVWMLKYRRYEHPHDEFYRLQAHPETPRGATSSGRHMPCASLRLWKPLKILVSIIRMLPDAGRHAPKRLGGLHHRGDTCHAPP